MSSNNKSLKVVVNFASSRLINWLEIESLFIGNIKTIYLPVIFFFFENRMNTPTPIIALCTNAKNRSWVLDSTVYMSNFTMNIVPIQFKFYVYSYMYRLCSLTRGCCCDQVSCRVVWQEGSKSDIVRLRYFDLWVVEPESCNQKVVKNNGGNAQHWKNNRTSLPFFLNNFLCLYFIIDGMQYASSTAIFDV